MFFYLVTVAGQDSDLHLRGKFTVGLLVISVDTTDIYASRSQAPLYRKSEARLEQTEQQNGSLELHVVLQSKRHSGGFVNDVCGANGSKNTFYPFSGSASPVCVHGSPSRPPAL